MNDLFRQCNKRAYEIEGTINDLYCDKVQTSSTLTDNLSRQMELLDRMILDLQQQFQN